MSEPIKRILVSVVGIPIILGTIWMGGYYFASLIAIIVLTGLYELYSMASSQGVFPSHIFGYSAAILTIWFYLSGHQNLLFALLIGLSLLVLLQSIFKLDKTPLPNVSVTIFGVLYTAGFLGSLVGIRESGLFLLDKDMAGLIILLFVSVWLCDTGAYFFGTRFGRHRLHEKVSPKKSVEGAVSGFLAGSLCVFGVYFSGFLPEMSLTMAILFSLIIGIFGQMGDLVESWLKRSVRIKDSSSLIPGHGGMLDRFDSMLVVSPLIYLLIEFNLI